VIVYEKARFGERAKGFENFAALYAVVALKGLARLHKEKNPPQPKIHPQPKNPPVEITAKTPKPAWPARRLLLLSRWTKGI